MSTGLFYIRQERIDAQVADLLADGADMDEIAIIMRIGRSAVTASFERICAARGPQALGTWRI